ncbi:MAG: hypothetical protein HKN76_00115, partial [Saprospiraceae bacterium]|nr:hypothetical protein [Saprospiraceae bacterium]
MSIIKKFIWVPLIMFHLMPLCCQEDGELRHEIEKIIRYDTDVLDGRTVGFILGVV